MKHLSTLYMWIMVVTTVAGQNNLFIPFGQTTSEVKSFLNTRDYISNIHEDLEMESVRAVLDEDKHVEYAFNQGALYATTVTRNYVSRKDAKDVEQNCIDYMGVISRGAIKEVTNENITCFTSVTDSRIIKLFVIDHKKSVTLTLTSLSRQHGPNTEDEDFYYEVELLQKKFISN